jgi:hypothetical protein
MTPQPLRQAAHVDIARCATHPLHVVKPGMPPKHSLLVILQLRKRRLPVLLQKSANNCPFAPVRGKMMNLNTYSSCCSLRFKLSKQAQRVKRQSKDRYASPSALSTQHKYNRMNNSHDHRQD